MAITHTGRVDSRPQNGRDAFVQQEADWLGVTVQQFLRYHDVVPCECRENGCEGWRVVYKVTGRRRGEA